MKAHLSASAAVLALGLALAAAPAAAQHDPPFVARGLPMAVAQESGITCRTDGGASMWPDGRSIMTWIDGVELGLYRTFDAEGGLSLGGFIETASSLDVSAVAGGGFVTAFTNGTPRETFGLGARIFDPQEEEPLRRSFPIAGADGSLPAVAAGEDGPFVIAWAVSSPAPAIVAARFDRAGNRIGGDIAVAAVAGSAQAVDVTRGPDGSFTVYWRQSAPSGGSLLQLRRFGAGGVPLGDPVAVGSIDPQFPRAAGAADGDALLVYAENTTGALLGRLLTRGGALGNAFPIFEQAANPATRAQAAFLGDGSFAAAAEIHFGGGAASIHLLRFDRAGHQLGPRIPVAVPTVAGREFVVPRLAATGDRIAVFFGRQTTDGSKSFCPLFVRVFDATLFADGFESGDLSAWTGGT